MEIYFDVFKVIFAGFDEYEWMLAKLGDGDAFVKDNNGKFSEI